MKISNRVIVQVEVASGQNTLDDLASTSVSRKSRPL